MRPQLGNRGEVARPLEVEASQKNKQGRAVDGAVVAGERHFSEARHFARAHLMQYFSRFGVGVGLQFRRLVCGEKRGRPGDGRVDPQHLDGGDDRVAAKGSPEPWDAGVGEEAVFGDGRQHVEVRDPPAQHFVEEFVGRFDRSRALGRSAQRPLRIS